MNGQADFQGMQSQSYANNNQSFVPSIQALLNQPQMVYSQDPSSYLVQPSVPPLQQYVQPDPTVVHAPWQGRDSNRMKRMREDSQIQASNTSNSLFRSGKPKDIKRDRSRPDPRESMKSNVTPANDEVRNEMNILLSQLLSDLGQSSNTLSLEDLYIENINLYQQIQAQAESIVNSRNISNNYSNSVLMHPADGSVQGSSLVYVNGSIDRLLGFVNETPVAIPSNRLEQLIESLPRSERGAYFAPRALAMSQQLSTALRGFLNRLHEPSPLPMIVKGTLPMQASARFIQRVSSPQKISIPQMLELPAFR